MSARSSGNVSVSVIIPSFNRAAFLGEAIESVLAQSLPVGEVIVVDDGSTDATVQVATSFGANVHCIRQNHAGPAAARNRGLREAAHAIMGFVDDDDLWPADRLAQQLPVLLDDPDVAVVLGHTQRMILKQDGNRQRFVDYRQPVRLLSVGAALFRRGVFEIVGCFNERMHYAEDDDWFMRAEELGIRTVFQPQVAQYYRFHQDNMTRDKAAHRPFLLHLAKNRLDRARKNRD